MTVIVDLWFQLNCSEVVILPASGRKDSDSELLLAENRRTGALSGVVGGDERG